MIAEVGKWTAVHLAVTLVAAAVPSLAAAQAAQTAPAAAPPAVTADDYARAERFLAAAVNPLVVGGTVNATWLPDDRFTYRSTTADGARVPAGRPGEEDARAAPSTTSAWPRRWPPRRGTDVDREEAAVPDHRAVGRRHVGGVRRRQPSATRATCKGAACAADPTRQGRQRRRLARRHARGVHQGLEPVGARPRVEGRAPAHDRRRRQLRLRHRQRRLAARARARSCCGRPTRRRSPRSSRTNATSARCTWSRPRPGIRC